MIIRWEGELTENSVTNSSSEEIVQNSSDVELQTTQNFRCPP